MLIQTPFDRFRDHVRSEWIDHNQHMNMGFYLVVLDLATDTWFEYLGLTRSHRLEQNVTTFCLEAHITYQKELKQGDPLRVSTQLLDFDTKRLHYFHQLYHATEGYLAATNELMSLHVSQATRRATPMTDDLANRLALIKEAHDKLPYPAQAGRTIGLNAKPTTRPVHQ